MRKSQIEDWCRLLNLLPELSRHAVYGLPVVKKVIRRLFSRFEQHLEFNQWPIGAVYCLRAKKERNADMRTKSSPLYRLTGVRQSLKPVSGIRRKPALRIIRNLDDTPV